VPNGASGTWVAPVDCGFDGVTFRVEVARFDGCDTPFPVGVGLDFDSVIPEINVNRIAMNNPTITRIRIMDLFF